MDRLKLRSHIFHFMKILFSKQKEATLRTRLLTLINSQHMWLSAVPQQDVLPDQLTGTLSITTEITQQHYHPAQE